MKAGPPGKWLQSHGDRVSCGKEGESERSYPLLRRYEIPGIIKGRGREMSILHHVALRHGDQRPLGPCRTVSISWLNMPLLQIKGHLGAKRIYCHRVLGFFGELLLRLGCDPMRVDKSDPAASAIFQMNGNLRLSDVLTKRCKELREERESAEAIPIFNQIMKAVYENDLQSLKKLCSLCTPLLPLESKIDPLTEAIRRGHLEAAMMLMVSGAPLCGLPLISVTPLHAAHSLPQLPVIIPVILRKVRSS
ncbi:uncharacterized protein LOC119586633 [Penaeus monodon]|uniref:uncharacterized protein LOC119586633 n=1 Tax=Penaeus monodon TaxID=6687 RepID=UPI0018A757E2|nr:uncharacterized protein LOC119586633 [Penaeus monodon]